MVLPVSLSVCRGRIWISPSILLPPHLSAPLWCKRLYLPLQGRPPVSIHLPSLSNYEVRDSGVWVQVPSPYLPRFSPLWACTTNPLWLEIKCKVIVYWQQIKVLVGVPNGVPNRHKISNPFGVALNYSFKSSSIISYPTGFPSPFLLSANCDSALPIRLSLKSTLYSLSGKVPSLFLKLPRK